MLFGKMTYITNSMIRHLNIRKVLIYLFNSFVSQIAKFMMPQTNISAFKGNNRTRNKILTKNRKTLEVV